MNKPRLARSSRPHAGYGAVATLVTSLWVALVFTSVLFVPFALWSNFTLARIAQLDAHTNTVWLILLSGLVTLGVPLTLAGWKYAGDGRRVVAALAWLPLVWNLGCLLLATQIAPKLLVTALRSQGTLSGQSLGDSHDMTRLLSAIGHGIADEIDPPEETPAVEPPPSPPVRAAQATEITIPLSASGNAILMNVELRGPAGRISLPYLFDTGASYTTITSATAETLGVVVPDDAPTLQFNTASGPRESRMVYLPGLKLGESELSGLLVSVCDGCANERTKGLLGINVMREFFVQMDYQAERTHLIPRQHDGRPNRAYDIGPTVKADVEGNPAIWLGRIRWVLLVKNRGTTKIESVVPEVQFSDGQKIRGAAIDRIEPGAVGRSIVEGKTKNDKDVLGFTINIAEAYW